jgi:hypothetical protein
MESSNLFNKNKIESALKRQEILFNDQLIQLKLKTQEIDQLNQDLVIIEESLSKNQSQEEYPIEELQNSLAELEKININLKEKQKTLNEKIRFDLRLKLSSEDSVILNFFTLPINKIIEASELQDKIITNLKQKLEKKKDKLNLRNSSQINHIIDKIYNSIQVLIVENKNLIIENEKLQKYHDSF